MARSPEEARKRLENIQTIEPLLAALRTISLASWNQAINRQNYLDGYIQELGSIFDYFSAHLKIDSPFKKPASKLFIILGSNRGLCGKFNHYISDFTHQVLSSPSHAEAEIVVIGERLIKILNREKFKFTNTYSINNSSTIKFRQIIGLSKKLNWIKNNSEVSVIYNHYQGAGKSQPRLNPIYPDFVFKNSGSENKLSDDFIIDTDASELYESLQNKLSLLSLYSAFLSSAASEHSTRFLLMENASNNADRISEEVEIEVQLLRRQKITSEMRELAIGAGLLKNK